MKKLLSLLCAAALLLGLGASALAAVVDYGAELNPNEKVYGQTFHDVPKNHWCFKMIEELVERGAINGYPDGNFYPNNTVTRQEFAKIMVVAAGEPVYPASNVSFADVPLNHWANPFIEAAKPYMTAYENRQGNRTFKPEAGALREDMAVAVVKLRGYDARLADLSMLTTMFSDVDSISVSARPYVALAVENGIISGYPGQNGQKGTFGAQRTITRCEAAAILWRAFQYGSDEKVIPGDQTEQPAASDPVDTPVPTESAQPSPSLKPTLPPEPVEPEKPYIAETLVKNVEISNTSTMMTMDDDSNLIFYNKNTDQIVSLNPKTDKTKVLLDVSSATCEMPVEGETASLSALEDEDAGSAEDGGETGDQETTDPEPAPPATVTYEDLTVKQVFWDDVAQRLLVWGEFASVKTDDDGWNHPDKGNKLNGIFILKNGGLTLLGDIKPRTFGSNNNTYRLVRFHCALSNGTFVIQTASSTTTSDAAPSTFIFDIFENEKPIMIADNYFYRVFQNGSNIYFTERRGDNRNDYGWLYEYDYGTGRLEKTAEFVGYVHCYSFAKKVIYSWDKRLIQAVRVSDGATQGKLDPQKDVEVKDLRPLPTEPSNLWVTSDEQYLFYDSSASAIRVIRANPDA